MDIRAKFQTSTDELTAISKSIEERLKLLEEKENKWKSLEDKLKENAEKAKERITLNIGGKKFTTAKSNLLQIEHTYFYALLSSDESQPDEEDGSYFIDRNPRHFDRILDYLKTKKWIVEDLSKQEIEKLEDDLGYYQIVIPKTNPVPPPTFGPNPLTSSSIPSTSPSVGFSFNPSKNESLGTATNSLSFAPKSIFGSQSSGTFGTGAQSTSTFGDFGAQSSSSFGQSAPTFGSQSTTTFGSQPSGTFGTGVSPSSIGSTPAFGVQSVSTFGTQSLGASTNSVFGQSQPAPTSLFGGSTTATSKD